MGPLKDASNAFGNHRSGNSLVSKAIIGAKEILTNHFPLEEAHGYVISLSGNNMLDEELATGEGDN